MSWRVPSLFFVCLVFLLSCADQTGKRKSQGETLLSAGGLRQGLAAWEEEIGLDYGEPSAVLNLWQRGPGRDNGDPSINAFDNLDSLARSPVGLYDLESLSLGLRSPHFMVLDRVQDGRTPRTTAADRFIGEEVRWRNNAAFKMLMAYAHLSRARRHVEIVFPELSFNNSLVDLRVMPVYAAQPGNPLFTSYAPIDARDNNGARIGPSTGIVYFYENGYPSFPYGTADESDAIIHEYAHVVQHAMDRDLLETAGFRDMDTLLEGTADFFAAALQRDTRILDYLAANSTPLFAGDRTGPTHIRSAANMLSFPYSYVQHIHLDGRVVSAALGDIVRLAMGDSIRLMNCRNNCDRRINATHLSRSEAFDYVLRLSFLPIMNGLLSPNSTLQSYVDHVVGSVRQSNLANRMCGTSSNTRCRGDLETEITLIFRSRGLAAVDDHDRINRQITTAWSDDADADDAEVIFFRDPVFIGMGGASRSNNNSVLDPCELVFVAPHLRNNSHDGDGSSGSGGDGESGSKVNLYDIRVSVESLSGFTEAPDGAGGVIEDLLTWYEERDHPDNRLRSVPSKLLGWLPPSFDTKALLNDDGGRFSWFETQEIVGSQLEFEPTLNRIAESPNKLGWLLRAPNGLGGNTTASITFRMIMRPYNSGHITTGVTETRKEFEQSLTVNPNSSSNFCD